MKIALAQIQPETGAIEANIKAHLSFCELGIAQGADLIVFPELSITGYEPELSKDLAMDINDSRFNVFQDLSDVHQTAIAIGAPTKGEKGINITLVLFKPNQSRSSYSKKYLHADEVPYFVPGHNFPILEINNTRIGLAICYEISVPDHAELAAENKAEIYLSSVAKYEKGVTEASQRLSEIAQNYKIPTLLCNCLGVHDGGVCVGKSSVWNPSGKLVSRIEKEGLLIYDTDTGTALSVEK